MTDTLPHDQEERTRRLAALTADLDIQVRRALMAYAEKYGTLPRPVDREDHSAGDPFAAPAYYVRSRRHQGNSRRDHHED